ncbi:MAG: hypothetical protein SGPRY_001704 [Prymnesium sp.]
MSADADSEKVACCAAVPESSTDKLPANKWLQPVLEELGGRGGGRPFSAQGSGSDINSMPKAVEIAKTVAAKAFA